MHTLFLNRMSGALILIAFCSGIIAGCTKPQLMPTPNLYANCGSNPFSDVPAELRTNTVDVLYVTDRMPIGENPEGNQYDYKRSRSAAFGISQVKFGNNVSWDQLVTASTTQHRMIDLAVTVPHTTELGRFDPTPPRNFGVLSSGKESTRDLKLAQPDAETLFKKTLTDMLKRSPVKEVYLSVHGVNNQHVHSVSRIAEIWHFLGRQGVPIAYSWPAGSPGLKAYMYDRESSEFTIYHLKQLLKLIASVPEVQKINIIGHSRGTDVVSSALRELHIEYAAAGKKMGNEIKLGTVVLAAPDMDFEVTLQRMTTAQVGQDAERFALYVGHADKLLELSNWLFGGLSRLGEIKTDMFTPLELEAIRLARKPEIIDAKVSESGSMGHDYFVSNPAVNSDLVLLLRYKAAPGVDFGRPLGTEKGFWVIDDKYPTPARIPTPKETAKNTAKDTEAKDAAKDSKDIPK